MGVGCVAGTVRDLCARRRRPRQGGRKTGKRRMLFPATTSGTRCAGCWPTPVVTGPGVNRLVQHSAGSGKSNTIAWTAHRLTRLRPATRPTHLAWWLPGWARMCRCSTR